jgi:hypothetical protein
MLELDVTVLGGLKMTVGYSRAAGDRSVGEPRMVTEDLALYDRRGRRAEWAEARMKSKDWECVQDQINNYEDQCDD